MHGDGFLRANAGLATAVLGGPTFPITECNKGNKGNKGPYFAAFYCQINRKLLVLVRYQKLLDHLTKCKHFTALQTYSHRIPTFD